MFLDINFKLLRYPQKKKLVKFIEHQMFTKGKNKIKTSKMN